MGDKPKYLYFNVRAKGELPRLICAAGGLPFEEERVPLADWGPEYKSETPYGQLPCVIVKERWFAQRLAISLYFARQCGFYLKPSDEQGLLEMDHALYFVEELMDAIVKANSDKAFRNNPETLEKFKSETLPQKLPLLEKLLKDNGTGYYVGDKLSIVDIDAFDFIEHVVDEMGIDYLDTYPLVKANFEKVGQIPGIKAYVSNRPTPEKGFEKL